MKLTKRNHYNPCFWTALWNPDYFRLVAAGEGTSSPSRKQPVHALSVKSGIAFPTTVERIHYDKNLGVAEITREAAEGFVRRHHPDLHEQFVRENVNATYPVFIDYEEILTAIENLPPYQILLKVALTDQIESAMEKANIGSFVILQWLRSHAIMNAMIDWHHELGYSKFEHFIKLKWMLSDTTTLFNLINPIVCCQWTLFAASSETFPLCDSPILVKPQSVMVVLSPKLLLEIEPHIKAQEDQLPVCQQISTGKLEEYRCRTIGNTFREIIGDKHILERWQDTPEFRTRIDLMQDVKNYNKMVLADGERELWQLNAYAHTG